MDNDTAAIMSESKTSDEQFYRLRLLNKGFLEHLDVLLKILSRITIASGILLIALYCIHIDFYPKGLSVGDTIAFIFAILSFGIIDIFGVLYAAFSVYWIIVFAAWVFNFFQKRSSETRDMTATSLRSNQFLKGKINVIISIFVFVVMAVTFFGVAYEHKITDEKWKLILSFLTGGFLLVSAFAFESPRELEPREKKIRAEIMPVIAFFVPIAMGSWNALLETTMSMAGLRVMDHPIRLSKQNYEIVADYARTFKTPIQDCGEKPNGEHIVTGVNILWHGLGDLAKLQIGAVGKNKFLQSSPYVEFDIKDTDIHPISSSIKPCAAATEVH